MLLAALLIFVLLLLILGTLIGKFSCGRGQSLLGLTFTVGLGWTSYRLITGVRAGTRRPDDGLVVYVLLAVFVVMAIIVAACYGLLLARGKLPRQRR